MSDHRPNADVRTQRLMWLLFAALLAWGIYLAIGAFLFNRDVIKGGIVLACSLAFLMFWAAAVWLGRWRPLLESGRERGAANGWSLAAMATASVSLLCMVAASAGWLAPQSAVYRPALVISQAGLLLATVLAMVGLSDRLRTRWRGLGLLALALVVVTFAVGMAVPPIEIGPP